MNQDTRTLNALALARRGVLALACALILAPHAALADPVGPVTKLPMPRFASLKTDRVNLREGPSKEHATKWVYERAGLPVEITAEFEIWRKVRDFGRHRGLGASFAAFRAANGAGHAE